MIIHIVIKKKRNENWDIAKIQELHLVLYCIAIWIPILTSHKNALVQFWLPKLTCVTQGAIKYKAELGREQSRQIYYMQFFKMQSLSDLAA